MLSIAERKLYYSITLFKIFKLNSGYVDFNGGNVKINYANKKIKILTIKKLMPNSNSINLLKHFTFLKLSSAMLIGEDIEEYKFYLCAIINSLNPIAYNIFKQQNSYFKYKNDVIFLAKNSTSGVVAEIDFVSNVISLITIMIKKVTVKLLGGNND